MSTPTPETSSTSTPSASDASDRAAANVPTAGRTPTSTAASVTRSCTSPSTTTHGSPMPRSRPDESAASTAAFAANALAFYATHGVTVRRVLSDNAFCYTSRAFLAALTR